MNERKLLKDEAVDNKVVPKKFVPRTPMDQQRIRVEKLMEHPEKPVAIPAPSTHNKEKKFLTAIPTFVRNVMGSSAGAGSGEFHVYRHLRRKEYARQKHIQQKSKQEMLDDEFQQRIDNNRSAAEAKTAKKRAKRLKKKAKQKRTKLSGDNKTIQIEENDVSEECSGDSDEEGAASAGSKAAAADQSDLKPADKTELLEEETANTVSEAVTSEEVDEVESGELKPLNKPDDSSVGMCTGITEEETEETAVSNICQAVKTDQVDEDGSSELKSSDKIDDSSTVDSSEKEKPSPPCNSNNEENKATLSGQQHIPEKNSTEESCSETVLPAKPSDETKGDEKVDANVVESDINIWR